jgi:sulfane dehydrogenase subunit SoxC
MRSEAITHEELRLAARNHALPLEALRYDITPIGLHYVYNHFDIPEVDVSRWRLSVGGVVRRPLTLELDDLMSRPSVTATVTLECAGNGRALLSPRPISQPWVMEAVGTARWTGTPLRPLLDEAGLGDGVVDVLFTGLDRGLDGGVEHDFERSLPLDETLRDDVLLAYEVNGVPLPPQHGYPLRLLVPGWYGMAHVKWLSRITAVGEPFRGYQQARSYRYMTSPDDPGEPVTRMAPRSLTEPPGIPDFLTRGRFLRPGPLTLRGRAWSGWGPVTRVEVSVDGGSAWGDAELGEAPAPFAWSPWTFRWDAQPGEYEVCSRATDSSGASQPSSPVWNLKGYSNNEVQRVRVTVRP